MRDRFYFAGAGTLLFAGMLAVAALLVGAMLLALPQVRTELSNTTNGAYELMSLVVFLGGFLGMAFVPAAFRPAERTFRITLAGFATLAGVVLLPGGLVITFVMAWPIALAPLFLVTMFVVFFGFGPPAMKKAQS